MPKLSGATVSFERKISPAQYESASASVVVNLVFDPEQEVDVNAELASALASAKDQVFDILGLGGKASVRKAQTVSADIDTAAVKKVEPAKAAVKSEPAKTGPAPDPLADPLAAATPAPAKTEEAPAPAFTRGDVNKAIAAALERLKAQGISTGPADIKRIIEAYVPENIRPALAAHVRVDSYGDLISDINKLGR